MYHKCRRTQGGGPQHMDIPITRLYSVDKEVWYGTFIERTQTTPGEGV